MVTSLERAERSPHRPVLVSGFGEQAAQKTVTYMPDLVDTRRVLPPTAPSPWPGRGASP
ncbi:MAG: hypothetical protein QNK04_09925 [Myxococcota bacterium]|nr:hypothetical protein [Myxococcota bacterium]